MRLKRKRVELKPVPCPLCGKFIRGRDAERMARGFVRHIQRCKQYRALTACAAVLRGIRVPRYGHKVLGEASGLPTYSKQRAEEVNE